MHFLLLNLLFINFALVYTSTSDGGGKSSAPFPTNDLGLTFGHKVNKRENFIIIYFDVSNATLKEYRYYNYEFRPFGSPNQNEILPRKRLLDTHNSLQIVGLHEDDYVSCLSFIDEYEKFFKPRYACYEFTLGEKIVGSHHGSKSGYLAPLLFAVAFIIHVFIAIVHHIKAKNYAHKLLHRFIDVTPGSKRRKITFDYSLKELDHPHVPASVQRRLSRVTIDVNHENQFNHRENFPIDDPNDELPLYTLPHNSRRVSMQAIPENRNSNTLDSVSSMRHLFDSTPWMRHANRSISSSIRRKSQLHV